jgi:hypothetical protein
MILRTRAPLGVALLIVAGSTACRQPPQAQAGPETPSYFGQPVPGLVPERFAPGVVSTDAIELNGVFTPDFREFFFARMIDGVQTLHHSVLENGTWTEPRPLMLFPGGTLAVADDMAVSPDGRELYFLGVHPHPYDEGVRSADIWVSRRARAGDGWPTAEVVPPPISSTASEVYPVVVADGSLYFTSSRPGGPGGFGGGDLHVSFRLPDGGWTEPVNLGETINTDEIDYCPMVTPDGRYLFFSRRRGAWADVVSGDVYWVDIRIIDRFRP